MPNQLFLQRRMMYCLLLIMQCCSCQRVYDVPPSDFESTYTADLSIRELRARHVMGKFEQITDAKTIVGVVVADDRSDNFYKSIVVQDSSGGITIRMDGIQLNANYPVGRKLAVNLKGLWLGDYGKLIQLGAGVDLSDPAAPALMPIPQALFDQYFRKGQIGATPLPLKLDISQLNNNYQSMLIQLDQVEFAPADTGKTYADVVNKLSANRTVKNCNGSSILLRTSGYADFASFKTPSANGKLIGIYSVFGTTKQFLIRDTGDVQMIQKRCP